MVGKARHHFLGSPELRSNLIQVLREEHFLQLVLASENVDVLLITGMRDEAPVPFFAPLVPSSRLVEVNVVASERTRRRRRSRRSDNRDHIYLSEETGLSSSSSAYSPSLIFNNKAPGKQTAERFAEENLVPLIHPDLLRLAGYVHAVAGFLKPGTDFRHVLGIAQQPGGLPLCTSLLQSRFIGDWSKVQSIVCCEAGGFVYASVLALRVDVPLSLIREAGKLPPLILSVAKPRSHISSLGPNGTDERRLEIERDSIRRGAPVVIIDDVLSTGRTLCAVLELLAKVGIDAADTSITVLAEFPAHRGRERLYEAGFGAVRIQSLLVFDRM